MDEELEALNREALIAEAKRLRAGIREHRDSSEHELCLASSETMELAAREE